MESVTLSNLDYELGSHVQKKKSLFETVSSAINKGMYSLQIFLGNPQSLVVSRIEKEDIEKTRNLLLRYPTNLYIHAPYIYNLCGKKDCLAWSGNKDQDAKMEILIKELEYQLQVIDDCVKGTTCKAGVVIHPGNCKDRKLGLNLISQSINKINFNKLEKVKLLLENCAGQGDSLAIDLSEISVILNGIKEENKKYLGVCIDTCHLFASGVCNLKDVNDLKNFFISFKNIIGLEYLNLIHLNDSKTKCGSRVDRHELISNGEIWNEGIESLRYLLNFCKNNKVPLILETDSSDMNFFFNL
jgi:deoxyribonuclease-4